MEKKNNFEEINILAFTSVVLAGVLLGFIVHEITHLILIKEVTSVTIRFGGAKSVLSTCCLSEGESALEELAYFVQFAVTVGWILINNKVFLQKEK
ncbi:MAG: hypothetical protein ABIH20_02405 [Candidatus Diapherotrites archaeon]